MESIHESRDLLEARDRDAEEVQEVPAPTQDDYTGMRDLGGIWCHDCQMWLNGTLQWEEHKERKGGTQGTQGTQGRNTKNKRMLTRRQGGRFRRP